MMRLSTSAETYEHLSATLADSMTHRNSSMKLMHESEEKPKKVQSVQVRRRGKVALVMNLRKNQALQWR